MDIICTIGPRTSDPASLAALKNAGMTVCRLNGAHNLLKWHAEAAKNIKELGLPIYMDLPGSKPRPFQTYSNNQVIEFARTHGVHWLGLSNAEDPMQVSRLDQESGLPVIAKIETDLGLQYSSVLSASAAGVQLDRTDFLINAGRTRFKYAQEQVAYQARVPGKMAWVASDILKSMISDPDPTAAEISDILYLKSLGFNGFILAGETAVGRYPVEATKILQSILEGVKVGA